MLWECLTYSSSRELQEKLENGFECFDSLNSLGKSSFILGSEDCFDSLLSLVKDYVVNIWETCVLKLYGDDSSQSQSSTRDVGDVTGFEGHSGEPDTGEFQYSSICVNACCSTCENECLVDGMCATMAN